MSISKQQKRLARTAASIHAILASEPIKLVRVEPPDYWWERVQEDLQLLRRAQGRVEGQVAKAIHRN